MNVPSRQIQCLLIACLTATGLVACAREQNSAGDPVASQADLSKSSLDVTEGPLPGGGRALIKDEGWQIPALESEKTEHLEPKAKTIDGVEVSLDLTIYRFESGNMHPPADATTAMGLGELNVLNVFEYKIDQRRFAYAFQVTRSGRRGVTAYTIYDEDGDGRFETLGLSDKRFLTTLRPHVPKWALMKKK